MKNNFNTLEELLEAFPKRELGKSNNIANQKINYITPICRVNYNSSSAYWACKCDCGKYFVARGTHIMQGKICSCGCYSKKINHTENRIYSENHEDLLNQRFLYLTAIEYVGKDKSNHALWKCKCDCGNIKIVSATHLKTGHTISCGCIKRSKYEEQVENWLIKNKIKYNKEVKIKELGKLRFDFQVFIDDYYIFIEVQGQQHYKPISLFGGEESFKKLISNDNKKREYCQKNNIKLLEIKYNENIEQVLNSSLLIKKLND